MKKNHRRSNPDRYEKYTRDGDQHTLGGFVSEDKPWGYIRRGGGGFGEIGPISGEKRSAQIPYESAGGHRGAAAAVAGAKKFVRSRMRFHENAATKRLAMEDSGQED